MFYVILLQQDIHGCCSRYRHNSLAWSYRQSATRPFNVALSALPAPPLLNLTYPTNLQQPWAVAGVPLLISNPQSQDLSVYCIYIMSANYWQSTQCRFWNFTKEQLATMRQKLEEDNAELVRMFPLPQQRHLNIYFNQRG